MIVLLAFGAGSPQAAPATTNTNARLAIHLLPLPSSNPCNRSDAAPGCSGIVSTGDLVPVYYFACVLVTNGDPGPGVSGVSFGINYDGVENSGVDIWSWTTCGDSQFPSGGWPAPNSSNGISWNSTTNCQRYEPSGVGTGVMALAGYFYMGAYSPDQLHIIPKPASGTATISDCNSVETVIEGTGVPHDPSRLGYAAFSAGAADPGYNPCSSDLLPYCSISGESGVIEGSTDNIYIVTSNVPAPTFEWSITGHGSIVGSTAGSSVTVTAGAPGSFTLTVVSTNGSNTSTCSRMVTVDDISCWGSGPTSAQAGDTGLVYGAGASWPTATFSWATNDFGQIVGPTTGPSVTVDVSPFKWDGTLEVYLTTWLFDTIVCTKRFGTYINRPCSIQGPRVILAGSTGNVYTASTSLAATSYSWSISGNGTISGSTHEPSVTVDTGDLGRLYLRVDVSDGTHTCTTDTYVDVVNNSIVGPDSLPTNGLPGVYTLSTNVSGSCSWSLSGNGHWADPAQWWSSKPEQAVQPDAPGSFTLLATVGGSTTYTKTVIVTSQCPVPSPNANAKILVHLIPTQKGDSRPCRLAPAPSPECSSIRTNGGLYPPNLYWAVVLVADASASAGVRGAEFAIQFDWHRGAGVDVWTAYACDASWAIPSLSNSGWMTSAGSGTLIVWNDDKVQRNEPGGAGTGVVTPAALFYLGAYSPDVFRVVPHLAEGAARVYDGHGCPTDLKTSGSGPSALGYAQFTADGNVAGYNPCGMYVPVIRTTWSGIKALYRDH